MKKIFLLLFFATLLSVCAACAEEPTHITDVDGLKMMAQNPEGSYVLDNDIDLMDWDWMPFRFSGTLDGNGHTIRHLTVTDFDPETGTTWDGNNYKYKTRLMGFFSVLDNACVRNIRFADAAVYGESEEPAFAAILAAISTHSTIENVSVSGSACLYCGAKMGGVAGIVGFGTGSITDSEADVTLIYADTNTKKKCEQFLGGALAAGYMDCKNVKVRIDGYASVYGYAHCGGVIGMFRQHEKRTKANGNSAVCGCAASGQITFFERNSDRRAYCKGIIGERLNKYVKLSDNDDSGFTRNEIKKYDQILLPEGWGEE